jgi:hypothetical protein
MLFRVILLVIIWDRELNALFLFSLFISKPINCAVVLSVQLFELNLEILPTLDQISYLISVQHVEKLENADFPILYLSQQRECENADQSDDANRDEADQVYE